MLRVFVHAIRNTVVVLQLVCAPERETVLLNHKDSAQASEQFFRSIFENAQLGITFFDIDGRSVFSNRALHEMLGYSSEELSHFEKWDEIVYPDERFSVAERSRRTLDRRFWFWLIPARI